MPTWPFPLMPMQILPDEEALAIAERAREEEDDRWVPITAEFANELLHDGYVARTGLGVSIIAATRRWDENSLCYCILPADKHRWRSHALLRIMTITQFEAWQEQWPEEIAKNHPSWRRPRTRT